MAIIYTNHAHLPVQPNGHFAAVSRHLMNYSQGAAVAAQGFAPQLGLCPKPYRTKNLGFHSNILTYYDGAVGYSLTPFELHVIY